MNEITYTHSPSGNVFLLKQITEAELLEFFTSESLLHIKNGTQKHNSMYLNVADNTFSLTELTAVYHDDKIVAFCIIPKYDKTILMRIYTSPEYRQMGIASFLINHNKVTRLSCLKENDTALQMYTKLGFICTREHTWVVDFERKL